MDVDRILPTRGGVPASDLVVPVSPSILLQAQRLLAEGIAAFPYEPNAAYRQLGRITAFARLDCTVTDPDGGALTLQPDGGRLHGLSGIVRAFEPEERPDGWDVAALLHPDNACGIEQMLRRWPMLRVVLKESETDRHDRVWLPEDRITVGPVVPKDGTQLIIRAEPADLEYRHLIGRSLSSLRVHSDKSHGLVTGWYHDLRTATDLPSRGLIVGKPRSGWGARQVLIGNAADQGFRRQLLDTLGPDGGYWQEYHPPIQALGGHLILRLFYYTDPDTLEWVFAAGAWGWREDPLKPIHGAEGVIFGPAVAA
jgi:hypothetical protein